MKSSAHSLGLFPSRTGHVFPNVALRHGPNGFCSPLQQRERALLVQRRELLCSEGKEVGMGCLLGVETKKSAMKCCSPYQSVLGQLGSLILPLCLRISKCEKAVRCPQRPIAPTLGVYTSTDIRSVHKHRFFISRRQGLFITSFQMIP